MNMPVNGSGGSIKGLELSAVFPFEMIAKPLSGFGMQASYSNTSSAIDLSTAGFNLDGVDAAKKSTIELPGLSKRVSNLVVYYEKDGFGARVAQRSRSDFVGEVTNFAGDRQLTYIKGESIVDLQLSYNLKLAGKQNLSILFQGINMTNAKFERYREEPSNVIESVKYGKTFLIGLSYKM
jgi:iron complex outermembrane receptor protein